MCFCVLHIVKWCLNCEYAMRLVNHAKRNKTHLNIMNIGTECNYSWWGDSLTDLISLLDFPVCVLPVDMLHHTRHIGEPLMGNCHIGSCYIVGDCIEAGTTGLLGFRLSSAILNTRKHTVSKTRSDSVFRRGRHILCWAPYKEIISLT
jgi:hypothetical protein